MQFTQYGRKAGEAVPANGNVLNRVTGQDVGEQKSNSRRHSDADVGAAQEPSSKLIATLQARAALAGFELVRIADGSFVVGRWRLTRNLPDIDAVLAFLAQVGAPK